MLYQLIRPFITRGDVQNAEFMADPVRARDAIALEDRKFTQSFVLNQFCVALKRLVDLVVKKKGVRTVADIGTAQGNLIAFLAKELPGLSFWAIDIMGEAITLAQKRHGHLSNLKFQKKDFLYDETISSFDFVLSLQTLEHIEDQYLDTFAQRLFRITQKGVIVSVPREPFWCLANILRLKYWSRLGNSPHHLQHWTRQGFEKFILRNAHEVWGQKVEMISISPWKLWTMVLLLNDN